MSGHGGIGYVDMDGVRYPVVGALMMVPEVHRAEWLKRGRELEDVEAFFAELDRQAWFVGSMLSAFEVVASDDGYLEVREVRLGWPADDDGAGVAARYAAWLVLNQRGYTGMRFLEVSVPEAIPVFGTGVALGVGSVSGAADSGCSRQAEAHGLSGGGAVPCSFPVDGSVEGLLLGRASGAEAVACGTRGFVISSYGSGLPSPDSPGRGSMGQCAVDSNGRAVVSSAIQCGTAVAPGAGATGVGGYAELVASLDPGVAAILVAESVGWPGEEVFARDVRSAACLATLGFVPVGPDRRTRAVVQKVLDSLSVTDGADFSGSPEAAHVVEELRVCYDRVGRGPVGTRAGCLPAGLATVLSELGRAAGVDVNLLSRLWVGTGIRADVERLSGGFCYMDLLVCVGGGSPPGVEQDVRMLGPWPDVAHVLRVRGGGQVAPELVVQPVGPGVLHLANGWDGVAVGYVASKVFGLVKVGTAVGLPVWFRGCRFGGIGVTTVTGDGGGVAITGGIGVRGQSERGASGGSGDDYGDKRSVTEKDGKVETDCWRCSLNRELDCGREKIAGCLETGFCLPQGSIPRVGFRFNCH